MSLPPGTRIGHCDVTAQGARSIGFFAHQELKRIDVSGGRLSQYVGAGLATGPP
jgi:hypothetical protein